VIDILVQKHRNARTANRGLPDDATVEDAMDRLYLLAKIEEGFRLESRLNWGVKTSEG